MGVPVVHVRKVRDERAVRGSHDHRPRRALGAILACALALGTSAVLVPGAGAAAKVKTGGEIVYGLEAETTGGWCIPSAQLAIGGIEVAAAIYDTLTVMNTKGEYVPYLAESVEPDAALTTWTIKLRSGIQFHDGTPLTADAVKQNIDAWTKGRLLAFVFQNIATTTVVDPLTVTVTTKVPWADFDAFLFFDGRTGIVAPAQLADPATCPTNLIGTGPFKKESWTPNQQFVAVRNPNYWQKDAQGVQLPYLDKITFRPNPDATARVGQLRGNQMQVIHSWGGAQLEELQGLGDQVSLMVEKTGRREVRYYLLNTAKAPFDDPVARRAVALALNRPEINEIRNNGLFSVADGPFDTKVDGYVKNPGFPKHDLAEATKLATQYKDAHGGQFTVVIEHTNESENSAEAQLIKEQLSEAGIDSTLQQEDQSAFINTALAGNFSMMLWRNHPGDTPDVNYVWWSKGSPLNFGRIDDPQLQALLDQGRGTADVNQRDEIYRQVNELFAEQLYNIWSYDVSWTVASRPTVKGLAGPPIPDKGGTQQFLYGRHPVHGISLTK